MIRLGLTGGIGSGKTTVAGIFEHLGVPVYYADDRAKAIVDRDLKEEIMDRFGVGELDSGDLDRKALAHIVFNDQAKLAELNSIVHPKVAQDWKDWCENRESENEPYVIKEAAILFESGAHETVDQVLVVTAPEDIRIQRVIDRDGVTEDHVKSRMNNQMDEQSKVELANHVINNDGDHSLLKQVIKIHTELVDSNS